MYESMILNGKMCGYEPMLVAVMSFNFICNNASSCKEPVKLPAFLYATDFMHFLIM